MHTAVMIWIAYMLCLASAGAMRENIHAATAVATFHASNASANASDEQKIEAIVVEARAAEDVQGQNQLAWDNDFNQAKQDPFDNTWFNKRKDPNYDPFKDDDNFNNFNKPRNNFNRPNNWADSDHSDSGTSHNYHRGAAAAAGVVIFFWLLWICIVGSICCIPLCCVCRGHFKARALREKLENLQLKHPPHNQRVAVNSLSDGMMRLAQEDRIMIKEKVNMAQELSGHFLGYSVQTANSFDVVSVTGGGEHVLSCREVQDLQAMLGMNLAGGLQAMGIDAAGAWAGRDKAPFRMMVGLPPMPNPLESGKMQVIVPQGVSSGQMIQVTSPTGEQLQVAVPPGIGPGETMEIQLPKKQGNSGPGFQQIMTGLVPGCAANNDSPFLYLDRPFAIDCCCVNRPKVDVFDVRGSCTVKLGIISDPFAWMDMTFGIHIGPNASESDPPTLVARGAACQPGTACKLCGLCCGRTCQEAYLEVVDPKDGDRTVAFITKGWAGGMQELFTSANAFYVDFGEVKDPACKALLLATALFLNYRFFEGRAGSTHSSSD